MAILAMLFLVGTFGLNFPIFVSTMAVDVFHADARGYGLLSSLMAVGTTGGALLGAGVVPRRSWLGASAAALGGGFAAAAVAPDYWSFAAALVAVFAIARAGCRALAIEPPDGRMHMTGPVAGQRKESE